MKTYSINEILESEVGMIIPRVEAKLVKIFDRKTGESEHGAWSLQNGELADNSGSIKVCFSGFPDISEKQGETLVLRAQSGKKGMSGIKVDENTYKGTTTKQLKITKSAIVLGADEEPDDIPMDFDKSGDMTATEARNAAKANVAPKKAITEDYLKQARMFLMQCVNMRKLCDTAAHVAAGELYDKAEIKDIGTSFFMTMKEAGHLKNMPTNNSLSKKENVEASEPEMMEEDAKF